MLAPYGALLSYFFHQHGVDFSYDFRLATFIEIALSNVTVRRLPTFALQKAAKNVGERRIRYT